MITMQFTHEPHKKTEERFLWKISTADEDFPCSINSFFLTDDNDFLL